jgi:hypothetical protein
MTKESIEDVKQAYALLFKENARLKRDAERMDWLENNLFHIEPDEWTAKFSPHLNTWRIFAPKGVQGSARAILDAAIEAAHGITAQEPTE